MFSPPPHIPILQNFANPPVANNLCGSLPFTAHFSIVNRPS